MKLTTMVIMALTIVALIWINEAEAGKDCIDLWERPMDCRYKDESCMSDSECLGSLKCKGTIVTITRLSHFLVNVDPTNSPNHGEEVNNRYIFQQRIQEDTRD